jgi:hypothetical protein
MTATKRGHGELKSAQVRSATASALQVARLLHFIRAKNWDIPEPDEGSKAALDRPSHGAKPCGAPRGPYS